MRKENFMQTLPSVLAEDENLQALAQSVASSLEERARETELASIYTRIDTLPEELLDILAYDFKVDWWDWALTLPEKRETLKRSWYVHRHMATPAAVTAALTAIYADTECMEWFTYGGKPYHFRLSMTIPAEDIASTKHERVLELLRFYRNLRSVMDNILYVVETPIEYTLAADSRVGRGMMLTVLPEIEPETQEDDTGTVGIVVESLSVEGESVRADVLGITENNGTLTVKVQEIRGGASV